jgi:hypothetical protein
VAANTDRRAQRQQKATLRGQDPGARLLYGLSSQSAPASRAARADLPSPALAAAAKRRGPGRAGGPRRPGAGRRPAKARGGPEAREGPGRAGGPRRPRAGRRPAKAPGGPEARTRPPARATGRQRPRPRANPQPPPDSYPVAAGPAEEGFYRSRGARGQNIPARRQTQPPAPESARKAAKGANRATAPGTTRPRPPTNKPTRPIRCFSYTIGKSFTLTAGEFEKPAHDRVTPVKNEAGGQRRECRRSPAAPAGGDAGTPARERACADGNAGGRPGAPARTAASRGRGHLTPPPPAPARTRPHPPGHAARRSTSGAATRHHHAGSPTRTPGTQLRPGQNTTGDCRTSAPGWHRVARNNAVRTINTGMVAQHITQR